MSGDGSEGGGGHQGGDSGHEGGHADSGSNVGGGGVDSGGTGGQGGSFGGSEGGGGWQPQPQPTYGPSYAPPPPAPSPPPPAVPPPPPPPPPISGPTGVLSFADVFNQISSAFGALFGRGAGAQPLPGTIGGSGVRPQPYTLPARGDAGRFDIPGGIAPNSFNVGPGDTLLGRLREQRAPRPGMVRPPRSGSTFLIENNNPGALRPGGNPFNGEGDPITAPNGNGRFRSFRSRAAGLRALAVVFRNLYRRSFNQRNRSAWEAANRQPMAAAGSLLSIFQQWAPPGDPNDPRRVNNPAAYARNVAQAAGIDSIERPLTEEEIRRVLPYLMDGIIRQENGGRQPYTEAELQQGANEAFA